MESQSLSSQDQDGLAGEVMENVGVSEDAKPQESVESSDETSDGSRSNETLAVQKRLKAQKRAHEREVRELHARIGDLESRMTQPNTSTDQAVNPYNASQGGDIEQTIHKAVSFALQQKEMEERKAQEMQQAAHVQRKYQDFQKHLDGMGDKYDDFHEKVFDPNAAFTNTMRDYASTLPKSGAGSAGEVLYKLAKNPSELERIAKLHPHDQASEMSALSHALISGGEGKSSNSRPPLGNIKSNPVVNSHAVTEKTPIGELRKRLKAGWK